MTISPTSDARSAVVRALKASADVTALVPADRIYPNKTANRPARPYIRLGPMASTPTRSSGRQGGTIDAIVHVFVGSTSSIKDPERVCGNIVDAVAVTLEALASTFVVRTSNIPDAGEADLWHGTVLYELTLEEAV